MVTNNQYNDVLYMVNKQYIMHDTQYACPERSRRELKYSIHHAHHASRSMQNKPNYKKGKMNVTKVLTNGYENYRLCGRSKNKPNQTQKKARELFGPFAYLNFPDDRNVPAAKQNSEGECQVLV
jgi:hypothetical protein